MGPRPHKKLLLAFAVVLRATKDGLRVLAVPSIPLNSKPGRSSIRIKIKLPGGMQRNFEETAEEAVRRETEEETGLVFSGWRKFWVEPTPWDKEHIRYGFLADEASCTGTMRTVPIPDGDELLLVPEWVLVGGLLGSGKMIGYQWRALAAARRKFELEPTLPRS